LFVGTESESGLTMAFIGPSGKRREPGKIVDQSAEKGYHNHSLKGDFSFFNA
jgi:hypothetical protein